jgi:hypothetical protein
MNQPTFALGFLRPANRERLDFDYAGREQVGDALAWVFKYKEVKHPTFIATTEGQDLKAEGRIWVEPEEGRVLRTEVDVQDRKGWKARVLVTYKYFSDRAAWLPATMEETYENEKKNFLDTVTGEAVYQNYRPVDVKAWLRSRKQ